MATDRTVGLLVGLSLLLATVRAGRCQEARQEVSKAPPAAAASMRPLTVGELRALYEADPQAFMRHLYREPTPGKGHPDTTDGISVGHGEGGFPIRPGALDDAYWKRIGAILAGKPMSSDERGGGAVVTGSSGFVTDPARFRGTQFLPPYAGEFLQVWAPEPATRRSDALRDMQLYCSQLAHAGVNVVRVFYGYQSWRYELLYGNQGIRLADVLAALTNNGIAAIVTLGNSYGTETLVNVGDRDARTRRARSYDNSARKLRNKGKKMIIAEEQPWKVDTGFYQQPGADFIKLFTEEEFTAFLGAEWQSYVTHVLNHVAGNPSFLFLEYWNEPDGGSGKDVFPRIGRMIHATALLRAALAPGVKGVIEMGGPLHFATFATSWLDPLAGGNWVNAHVQVLGLHPAVVLNYKGEYVATTSSGYPFAPDYVTQGLRSSASVTGAIESFQGLLASYSPARSGFLNELDIRVITPQFHHDVELAARNNGPAGTWPETLGRMAWTVGTSPLNAFAMLLADGTPWHPKQLDALRGRYTVKAAGHTEGEVSASVAGIGSATARIHNPTGARLSGLVQPLVLEGGDTVLLAFADGLDDVPSHSQFGTYPASARPERFRIWVQAFRRSGTGWLSSGVQDLATVTGSALASLGPDLQFRDIDDNRPLCGVLPIRGSLLGTAFTTSTWLADYPNGNTGGAIDATWGGLGGCGGVTSKIATLFNPCGLAEYGSTPGGPPMVPSVEREFLIRGQIAGRVRQHYAGLASDVRGAFRLSEAGRDHFVLAFARSVRKSFQPGEHYGSGQDARVYDNPPGRAWSANYGDFFRNEAGEPVKREVIVVDLAVDAAALVTGSAAILESSGAYILTGGEAIDPYVACNRDGDTAVIARTAADAWFLFADAPADPALNWLGSALNGPATANPCGGYYLPVPYAALGAGPFQRQRFDVFHRDSHWQVFPWEPAVWLRAKGQIGFPARQIRVGEPRYPASHFLQEDWPRLQDDLHAIQQRDATLRVGADSNVELFFNAGWHSGDARSSPTMDIWDPHTWHPCTNPRIALSDRAVDGRTITVLATWNQFPRALRSNFVRPDQRVRSPAPAYEVRGVRFAADMGLPFPLWFPPAAHLNYGSTAVLDVAAGNNRISKSVHGPVAALLTPAGAGHSSRAYYQMGEYVYSAGEGAASVNLDGTLNGSVPRRRPPVARSHGTPVTLPAPHAASVVEVAAWLAPMTSGTGQRLGIAWNLPQASRSGQGYLNVAGATITTTDPHAEVVGVVPFTGAFAAGWPMVRVVWKTDDDVSWADFAVGAGGALSTSAVRRASSSTGTAGPFRTGQTEVSVSQNVIAFTHDGTVIAIRP